MRGYRENFPIFFISLCWIFPVNLHIQTNNSTILRLRQVADGASFKSKLRAHSSRASTTVCIFFHYAPCSICWWVFPAAVSRGQFCHSQLRVGFVVKKISRIYIHRDNKEKKIKKQRQDKRVFISKSRKILVIESSFRSRAYECWW